VEREEAEGKAGVHARKSGAKKAGATSEGLALEQLGALRGEGGEQNSDGLRPRGRSDFEDETKPAPLKPNGAAPSKIKTNSTHFATSNLRATRQKPRKE
jgi:hypothetical protein